MPQEPVEAVLFDLGGVLTGSPFPHLAAYAVEVGVAPDVLGATVREGAPLLAQCETGDITMLEYFTEIGRLLEAEHGRRMEGQRLWDAVVACMDPLPESVALVRETHRSHRTGLITNASTDTRERWRPFLPGDLFDVIVDSSEVRLRKPEPEIYVFALGQLGVAPERAVFVDDQPANVDGARALGMRGVVFESIDQVRRELVAHGVQIRSAV